MTPDEVDIELGRLLDEHLKKRSIGVHELVTQAFAVGCKYRASLDCTMCAGEDDCRPTDKPCSECGK